MAKMGLRNRVKASVSRVQHITGTTKYGLKRMPKGHWMRTDQAKKTKKYREKGIISRTKGKTFDPSFNAH